MKIYVDIEKNGKVCRGRNGRMTTNQVSSVVDGLEEGESRKLL